MPDQITDQNQRTPELDYFVVSTRGDSWLVSTTMARHIEACLDADPSAPWITFVDIMGSRIRVRSEWIHTISQSTSEQRARAVALQRALCQEHDLPPSGDS